MTRISFASCLFGVAVAATLLLVSGCSQVQQTTAPATSSTNRIVWPPAPEAPRIGYTASITRPADLGIRRSGLTRLGQWLTGSQKGNEPVVKPFGIALDENDDLCLTDTGANVVCFYESAKKKWHRWDKAGKVRFASPVSVAKRNGVLYVADSALQAVVAFQQDGKFLFLTTNHLQRPTGIATANGKLFVTDSQKHAVVSFDLKGSWLGEMGKRGNGPGEFNFPTHVSATASGSLLVTDSMNARVQVFDAAGKFVSQIGELGDTPGHFSRPKGLAVDSGGNVYVIDALFDNVQIFDTSGRLLLNFGAPGSGPGQFWLPNGIAISRKNEVFVADSYNSRIQVFEYMGPL